MSMDRRPGPRIRLGCGDTHIQPLSDPVQVMEAIGVQHSGKLDRIVDLACRAALERIPDDDT